MDTAAVVCHIDGNGSALMAGAAKVNESVNELLDLIAEAGVSAEKLCNHDLVCRPK
jgi:enoyl reductase-like protein